MVKRKVITRCVFSVVGINSSVENSLFINSTHAESEHN